MCQLIAVRLGSLHALLLSLLGLLHLGRLGWYHRFGFQWAFSLNMSNINIITDKNINHK